MGIRFFSAKICKKNISSQSEKKQGNKKEKHTYTQLHQYSRFSLSKKGVWPVFVATSLKVSLQKQNMPKTLSNTTSKILFLFKWPFPGRQDLFFLLILVYRSRRILLFGCRP